ncbi:MAG TPA: TIM-barrel domain-containing protein [Kofleriaceae bacterium]|nr:TIM-barrel domain-containing protein [Kofleriaceae bacterium]
MAWLTVGPAHAQAVGNYTGHAVVGRSVVVTTDGGHRMRLTSYGDATVRIQAIEPGAQFTPDATYDMVARHDVGGAFTVVDGGPFLELTAGRARIKLTKSPLRVQIFRNTTLVLADAGGATWSAAGVTQKFAVDGTERFAGLGHGFLGRVGKLELTGSDTGRNYGTQEGEQAPLIVPFYLSSKGYGVFVNSAFTNRFRFNVAGAYEIALAGREIDYFVMLGPDLPSVLAQYTDLTGKPRLPPLAMFGLALSDKAEPTVSAADWWQQKVHAHRAAGWPIDHMVNDNRWRAGGGERCMSRFEWDATRYADPSAFRTWMEQQGLVATLDFNRCIADQSAGWQPSFNLPEPGTAEFSSSEPDLTRADVRAWWWNLMWTKTLDPALHYPGDALWIDEFDQMGTAPAAQILGNGHTWGEMRNHWFLWIARALGEDGWDAAMAGAKRPFTWVRGMTAGGQRYATLWSGDIDPTYAEEKLQIRGMLAAGLSAFPYWGHDAGGFHGEQVTAPQFDELYQQWAMAMGAFSPYWKPHGTLHSRWPIDRSPEAQHVATVYGELRYQLLPYTYTFARVAAETGLPLARAMLLAYPEHNEAWSRDLQYLWGSELLVAPNPSPGFNTVSVWLPPGTWFDFWTDRKLDGNRTLDASAALGRVLVYAKAGAIVPMGPAASSTTFLRRDVLDIHVYDGADGHFTLLEDDGKTEGYRTGAGQATELAYTAATKTLQVAATTGTYDGAPATRRYRIIVHGLASPSCATIDGVEATQLDRAHDALALGAGAAWTARNVAGTLTVVVPASTLDTPHTIAVRTCTPTAAIRREAEDGITDATVTAKPDASGGAYVGGLNAIGRHVDVSVDIASAGDYELVIGYANGRARRAIRGLYVDGTRVADLYFASTPDWDAFGTTDPVRVALHAGANTIRIQTDDGDPETVDLDFIDVYPAHAAPPPFYQGLDRSALVVVDAEHHMQRTDAGGHAWQTTTVSEGYVADGAVIAQPNDRTTPSDLAHAPHLAYDVEFAEAGTHYVWIRGRSYNDPDRDTVTVGLDGAGTSAVTFANADTFTWSNVDDAGTIVAVDVPAPGRHTIDLWMRDAGAIVDRVLLTPDASYMPDGEGPDESGHEPPTPGDGDDGSPTGCGCQAPAADGSALLLLTVAAIVLRRRRRS